MNKLNCIKKLQEGGEKVSMLGDGLNDAAELLFPLSDLL